jgi:hypothetical protein
MVHDAWWVIMINNCVDTRLDAAGHENEVPLIMLKL